MNYSRLKGNEIIVLRGGFMNLDELILLKIVDATFYKSICPNCGWHNSIKDLAYFCPKCGKNLKCGHLADST